MGRDRGVCRAGGLNAEGHRGMGTDRAVRRGIADDIAVTDMRKDPAVPQVGNGRRCIDFDLPAL